MGKGTALYKIKYYNGYRYKVLIGDIDQRVREWVRQSCDPFEIRIAQGVVSKDKNHVHILISVPPEARRSVDAHMDFQSVTSTYRLPAGSG